jgi:hypothetical protein
MTAAAMHVVGMHGLGDNLHQRAIVRRLMERGPVFLETPWPSVYHDLVGPRLTLLDKRSFLRTQAKNEARERAAYSREGPPRGTPQHRIWYTHAQIRQHGGFLAAMAANSGMTAAAADFRLPIPAEWHARADAWVARWGAKPLMFYRPLVDRTEWDGCKQRNPAPAAYATLARSIRERFFVVSIADLQPGKEWTVGENIEPDATCHAGELEFEVLAALAARSLVFCSPGFAIILAQAVGAPLVAVFGGHESARLYDHGDPRQHFVQPRVPCECFNKAHACDKRIDLQAEIPRLRSFVERISFGQVECASV